MREITTEINIDQLLNQSPDWINLLFNEILKHWSINQLFYRLIQKRFSLYHKK